MRNTREILRQKWLLKRTHRDVGTSVGVSVGAVSLALARAAASGHYPNLAAALAVAGPPRNEDDIFESCVTRLIDVAGLDS